MPVRPQGWVLCTLVAAILVVAMAVAAMDMDTRRRSITATAEARIATAALIQATVRNRENRTRARTPILGGTRLWSELHT
jgi:hypothetical protein